MATFRSCNRSELQLYQVLQKANLLKYFETFIAQGGDDVQQLCEAGEEEFLEIMSLVGMANKPLHVRRLQKALQEWVTRSADFEVMKKYPAHVMTPTNSPPQNISPSYSMELSTGDQDHKVLATESAITTCLHRESQTREVTFSEGSNSADPNFSDSQQEEFKEINIDSLYPPSDQLCTSLVDMQQPALLEHQVDAIATAASVLAQEMCQVQPKAQPKKQIRQEIKLVMQMSTDDPNRMKALRKFAAIYGRFDSKRKNARPMSLHEISVNEAAAQLCSHFPALLTRREELFPLARQVVRESGYQYSKGHSRASESLVQSKLELGEAVSPTPATVTCKLDDSLSQFYAELAQVDLELTGLTKELDCIRGVLRRLLEGNDHSQMTRLTAQMDILNDRQTAMVKKRQRILEAIYRHTKSRSKGSSIFADCASSSAVPPESPSRGVYTAQSNNNRGRYYKSNCYSNSDELLSSNSLNNFYLAAVQNQKDSLFQEGLRIAMHYGMSDFAKELIGMKFPKEIIDNKTLSEFSASPDCYSKSGFMFKSSAASFSALSSKPVASSSSSLYSVSESDKSIYSLPSSASSSPAVLYNQEFVPFPSSSGHTVSLETDKINFKNPEVMTTSTRIKR